jgi:predicted protein tyrosine phosphatase
MRRILFICEGNIHRSRTAEILYDSTPGLEVRSAGLADSARVQVTEELLAWADLVFVMELRLIKMIRRRFPSVIREWTCLDIPDDYQFGQPELKAVLEEKLRPHLGMPGIPEGSP